MWKGKLNKRKAKKFINNLYSVHKIKRFSRWLKFANYKVGDLVNDCSGLNSKITEIKGVYKRVAKGYVLMDVDLVTTNVSCSLRHCGIEPCYFT